MRAYSITLTMIFLFGGMLSGQTIEERLQWARTNIDEHAVMRFSGSPERSGETKWSVTKIEGCAVELQQHWQRTTAAGDVETRVVRYSFDLSELKPKQVLADSSTGLPHLAIFASGEVFHVETELSGDKAWSTAASKRNLWMYFDSPNADNRAIVKKLARDLRDAVGQCRYQR